MLPILRSDESNVIESIMGLPPISKKSSYFERVSFLGSPKRDPFAGKVDGDVWKVEGNVLLRKKTSKNIIKD